MLLSAPLIETSLPAMRDRRHVARPRLLAVALAASLGAWLAGCSTPVLHSSVEVPSGYAATGPAQAEPEVVWWEAYGDPILSDLIRRAAIQNRDVRIAAQRVQAARAGETVSRSWLVPNVGVSAGAVDASTGFGNGVKHALPDLKTASAGVNVSWEVDLAGRLRAGASAAEADTRAAEDSERGVRLLVMTDVATNYFTLAGALQQLETCARSSRRRTRRCASSPHASAPVSRRRSTSSARRPTRRARTLRSRRSRPWPPCRATASRCS
jgi:hypothetical protein